MNVSNRDGTLAVFGKNRVHTDIDPIATKNLLVPDMNDFVDKLCKGTLTPSAPIDYDSARFTFGMSIWQLSVPKFDNFVQNN